MAVRFAVAVPVAVMVLAPLSESLVDVGSHYRAEAAVARDAAATERLAPERSARTVAVAPADGTAAGGLQIAAALYVEQPPVIARDSVAAAVVRSARRVAERIASVIVTRGPLAPADTVSGKSGAQVAVVDSAGSWAVGNVDATEEAEAVAV